MSKLKDRRREIHGMDRATAGQELSDLRTRLFELRLQKERGEVSNHRQFTQTRTDIARLMHHIGELDLADELERQGHLAPAGATPEEE